MQASTCLDVMIQTETNSRANQSGHIQRSAKTCNVLLSVAWTSFVADMALVDNDSFVASFERMSMPEHMHTQKWNCLLPLVAGLCLWRTHGAAAAGALAGRPVSDLKFMNPNALVKIDASTYFVKISAGLSVPNTLCRCTFLHLTCSCTQRSSTSRWRSLPSPRLLAIPIAAVASECRCIGFPKSISLHMDWNPMACWTPLVIPWSSDSPEDNDKVDWVVDQWRIQCRPCMMTPPEVDLLEVLHPAKSLSVKTSNVLGSSGSRNNTPAWADLSGT